MLSDIFEPLDSDIKSLIAHIKSVDPLYVKFFLYNFGLFLFIY